MLKLIGLAVVGCLILMFVWVVWTVGGWLLPSYLPLVFADTEVSMYEVVWVQEESNDLSAWIHVEDLPGVAINDDPAFRLIIEMDVEEHYGNILFVRLETSVTYDAFPVGWMGDEIFIGATFSVDFKCLLEQYNEAVDGISIFSQTLGVSREGALALFEQGRWRLERRHPL